MANDLQSFYNDRRRRGLSDKIIFNELEASGWPKAGLQDHIAAARQAYEKLPTAEYMADGEVIAYDVPQFMKARGITRRPGRSRRGTRCQVSTAALQ